MKPSVRRGALLVFTALWVSIVRCIIQNVAMPWSDGFGAFASLWFLHFIGLGLLCAIVAVLSHFRYRIFPEDDKGQMIFEERWHEAIVSTCFVLLALGLFVLVIRYWPATDESDPGY